MDGKELKTTVENWLNTQAAAFYDEGIQTLVCASIPAVNVGK
jgi:hypothetical protein